MFSGKVPRPFGARTLYRSSGNTGGLFNGGYMEQWDVYDWQRQKTGRVHERGVPLNDGEYHLVVHGCLFNAAGQMLIQQRQPFKEGWPNLWDVTVGGSALSGETPQQAIAREMWEEVGIRHDFEKNRPVFTIQFSVGFDDWFLVERNDVEPERLKLQPEEVQAVRWADREQIQQMIVAGSFIPYEPSLIDFIFSRIGRRGAINAP